MSGRVWLITATVIACVALGFSIAALSMSLVALVGV